LGLVEAPVVYMGLTGGLYCVSVGGWCRVGVGVEWWLRPLFFMVFLNFYIAKLFHIMIIWYICRNKTSEYGKGNTCASVAQYRWNEAERLVL
jgi:hypothetical protein